MVNKILLLFCLSPTIQEWNDDYLRWTPANYDNIQQIVLSPEIVWIPDIGIQNRCATQLRSSYVYSFARFNILAHGVKVKIKLGYIIVRSKA